MNLSKMHTGEVEGVKNLENFADIIYLCSPRGRWGARMGMMKSGCQQSDNKDAASLHSAFLPARQKAHQMYRDEIQSLYVVG